jgi:UDP-glucose 4-epimerase
MLIMNKKVFVTGADGFIGSRSVDVLSQSYDVIAGARTIKPISHSITQVKICDISSRTYWGDLLTGVNTIIHLAAVAHGNSSDVDYTYEVNLKGTLNLANQAAVAGVKRFIFLSSIGVNGISNECPFFVTDIPSPLDDYSKSKLEAEIGLKQISAETGMEFVIIRPPLVYGPDAPGNFGKLAKLAKSNLPLPFGAIHNKRSLVALDNLVNLIVTCTNHPNAANQLFLVSDDYDVSTTQLLRFMIDSAGRKPKLIPIPVSCLSYLAGFLGKKSTIERMCSSLQVDISFTKETLGWEPPISFEDGILKCFVKE